MQFKNPLVPGRLVKRYKRFLADVELTDGSIVQAHCNNSGTMKTCLEENAPVYLSRATNPKRKTQYSWEMIFINGGWIGVNTLIPNQLVFEAIKQNSIPELAGYPSVKREFGFEDSRLDIYAENTHEKCFVEVKNVSMKVGSFARFPDAITKRGLKHLETLIRIKQKGYRAIMAYVIQRMDVECFGTAPEIDLAYAKMLIKAHSEGVEILPFLASVTPGGINLVKDLPYVL